MDVIFFCNNCNWRLGAICVGRFTLFTRSHRLLEINKYVFCSLFTGKYNFGVVPVLSICTLFLSPSEQTQRNEDEARLDSFIQITVFCPPEPPVGAIVYRNARKVYCIEMPNKCPGGWALLELTEPLCRAQALAFLSTTEF